MTTVAVLLYATGCSSSTPAASGVPSATPSAAATASTTPSADPSAAATLAAVTAYQGYLAAYAHAAASADINDPALPKYIGGGLLSLSHHNLRTLAEHGAIELNDPTSAMVVKATADLSATPPTVTVTACVDYSSYQLVYKATHKPVPNSALPVKRYTSTATVQLYSGGTWLVSADTPHRDQPC